MSFPRHEAWGSPRPLSDDKFSLGHFFLVCCFRRFNYSDPKVLDLNRLLIRSFCIIMTFYLCPVAVQTSIGLYLQMTGLREWFS